MMPEFDLGGITTSAINFCTEMSRAGEKVDLLVMDRTAVNLPGVNQIQIEGIRRYWNLSLNDIKQGTLFNIGLLLVLALLKKMLNKRGRWLPVIFHNYHLPKHYDVVMAYRQTGSCYYFASHCVKADKSIALIHGNLHYMHETKTWDYMFPLFDKIACVSNAISVDFKEAFPNVASKIGALYNMFDVEGIKAKSREKCPYLVDKSKVNIITVSRIDLWHKKINRISEACSKLRKRGIDSFHWYVVGDGPALDENVQLSKSLGVSDLITFCGVMSNPFSLQVQCDFSVLTSITEAYSMAVIESKILCKPIVAMRYVGIEEALKDGEEGIVVEQSVDALCDALQRLINDRTIVSQFTNNLIRNPYSNNICYSQFRELTK